MNNAMYRNNPGAIYNRLAELAQLKPRHFSNLSTNERSAIQAAFEKAVRGHKSRKQAVWAMVEKIVTMPCSC